MQPDPTSTQFLREWWERKRGARTMPPRTELDPAELKPILRDIVVIDVDPGTEESLHRFTCRLAGTEVDARLGTRLTGLTLDDAPFDGAKAEMRAQYEAVVRERRPIDCTRKLVMQNARYVEYDCLVVPLANASPDTVGTLLAALDFKCAYLMEIGRPPYCDHPDYCDRIDLCLARGRPAGKV